MEHETVFFEKAKRCKVFSLNMLRIFKMEHGAIRVPFSSYLVFLQHFMIFILKNGALGEPALPIRI